MASPGASTRSRLPSALRLFALQKTTTTTTEEEEEKEDEEDRDVGSLCRGPRLFVYVSRGLMTSALRARRIFLSSSGPRAISGHRGPIPESSNILHLWNISKSLFRRPAIERLLLSAVHEIRCRAFYLPEYLTLQLQRSEPETCLGRM